MGSAEKQGETESAGVAERRVDGAVAAQGPVILTLQRSVGNAAVGRLLRAQPGVVTRRALGAPVRTLQRYEAFEHAQQGDAAAGSLSITLTGKSKFVEMSNTLSLGDINALADLYENPEDLWKADPAEVAKLKDLIARQKRGEHVQESEWDDATGGRYNKLNLRNTAHFGPRNAAIIKPQDGTFATSHNRERFKNYMNTAIVYTQYAYADSARLIPGEKQKWLDRAVIAMGFAEHYIMDAFSAGHLFNKEDFIALLSANLDALSKDQLSNLFDRVAEGVLRDATSKALLATYEPTEHTLLLGWRPNFDKQFAFKALLEELYKDPEGKQAVYSALVKVAHDDFSTRKNADSKVGIPVENDFEKWTLSGDKTLDTSPDTKRIIGQALVEFRKQMEPYRRGEAGPGGFAPGAEKVMAYFPRPTPDSIKYMSGRIAEVTDANNGTVAALVAILVRELPSILSALVDRKRIKKA